ncbi:MAG: class I SAM-dependent methyltransferase [Burkholderiales bacterium]|nr:class I SAM-dependent methyltransferase [Burkholderiales bacterium]
MRALFRAIREFTRKLIYPGLDLHTRNRASLRRYWRTGPRDVLDAGSGNGYFSWLAYESGARVVAMNIDQTQLDRAKDFLLRLKKADPKRIQFERCNLYDLAKDTRTFDEIICFEVLEHLQRDGDVAREFYRVLRPGGILHLCCPNRLHPRHSAEVLDLNETGGHVRAGYTELDYRELLEPLGFRINHVVGIGPKSVYIADRVLRAIRTSVGDIFALPLLPLALPCIWIARVNPKVPFSLYVSAVKPVD